MSTNSIAFCVKVLAAAGWGKIFGGILDCNHFIESPQNILLARQAQSYIS